MFSERRAAERRKALPGTIDEDDNIPETVMCGIVSARYYCCVLRLVCDACSPNGAKSAVFMEVELDLCPRFRLPIFHQNNTSLH